VRKTLLKGRGLLETVPLHGASLLLLGRVREGPTRFETGRAALGHAGPRGLGIARHGLLTALQPVGSKRRKCHDRPMECLLCEDTGWDCENHPDQPWGAR
jgi:hypothetical protein